MSKNIALAATMPDVNDRDSYIRVREHSHPLSADMARLADAVDDQADEIVSTLESTSAARLLQLVESMRSKHRMLATQLRKHAKTAAAHESELDEKMRMLRDVLEARHG
jgi:hypothetical protein